MSISISGSGRITGVARTQQSQDAASKAYVDSRLGLSQPSLIISGGNELVVEQAGAQYKVHVFNSAGTLTVSGAGGEVEYLLVGGGAGGAADLGGGAGAGGVATGKISLAAGSYQVTVGVGGPGEPSPAAAGGTPGGDTQLGDLLIARGGRGGGADGSGGVQGATVVSGQSTPGNPGGAGSDLAGGGGGGWSSPGGDADGSTPGDGGAGQDGSALLGSDTVVILAAGGRGGPLGATAVPVANTGSGGAGGDEQGAGAAGASGVLAIRYPMLSSTSTATLQHPLSPVPNIELKADGGSLGLGFVPVFANASDRSSTLGTTAMEGQASFLLSSGKLSFYRAGSWQEYPQMPSGNSGRATKLTFNAHYTGWSFIVDGKHVYSRAGSTDYEAGLGPNLHRQISRVQFPGESGNLVDCRTDRSSYALFDNGNLWAWGRGDQGQLGTGNTTNWNTPQLVQTNVTRVFKPLAGAHSTDASRLFIQKTDGQFYATGNNGSGVLGLGDTSQRNSFTIVPSLNQVNAADPVRQLYLFGNSWPVAFAVCESGRIWATGYNAQGALGTGDTTQRTVFTEVTGRWGGAMGGHESVVSIAAGNGYYTSGGDARSTVFMHRRGELGDQIWACGNNDWFQRGFGSTGNTSTPAPVNLPSIRFKKLVALGDVIGSIYALAEDGRVFRWGYNGYGQMFNGNNSNISVPFNSNNPANLDTQVQDILIAASDSHTYGHYSQVYLKMNDGRVWAAGYNGHGQLGDGTFTNRNTLQPMRLSNDVDVAEIATGGYGGAYYTVIRTSDGELYGTGYNGRHDLTNWTSVNIAVPIKILF